MELKPIIVAAAFGGAILLSTAECKAGQGFYLTAGIGINDSPGHTIYDAENNERYHYEWQDNGEAGCGVGLGYMYDFNVNWSVDLAYRHKSQCNTGWPVNDDRETSVDTYYIDIYWYPFQ